MSGGAFELAGGLVLELEELVLFYGLEMLSVLDQDEFTAA